MKTKLIKSLIAGALALLAFPLLAAPPVVTATLTPSSTNISVGDNFNVQVLAQLNTGGDLTGFGFVIDPAVLPILSFTGYSVGPGFFDVGSGNLVSGAFLGFGNANSNVLLATLNFKALSAGTNTLTTNGTFNGSTLGLFYLDANSNNFDASLNGSLSITVKGGGAVSAPDSGTTLALFSVGLVSLAVGRRFRKSAR